MHVCIDLILYANIFVKLTDFLLVLHQNQLFSILLNNLTSKFDFWLCACIIVLKTIESINGWLFSP